VCVFRLNQGTSVAQEEDIYGTATMHGPCKYREGAGSTMHVQYTFT
jgi:hypothetical protein